MEANFKQCIEFVLAREGGFVNHPTDPGGATNMGITIATLKSWRRQKVTIGDVQQLKRNEAVRIYHAKYWKPMSCPDLPAGVDLLVLDAGVLSGLEPSLNFLRPSLGLPRRRKNADGIYVTPKGVKGRIERQILLERANRMHVLSVISAFSERRRAFYRSLSTFKTFGKGWLRRVDAAERLAMRLHLLDRAR